MKKFIRLTLLSIMLLSLAIACGGSVEPVNSSITPTRVLSTPIPAQSPPEPTSTQVQRTSVDTQQGQAQQSTGPILQLKISEIPMTLPDYDRGDWRHWRDEDGDCQNTRHEVLIQESLKTVTFKDDKQCQVATGEWMAIYSGVVVIDATKLDIDHMVPLKNAHNSGGWAWDKDKKAAYANGMQDRDHLIAVTASANRSKGAKGPEEWRPTNEGHWCEYAIGWIQIKIDWGLSATNAEWIALQDMLRPCDNPPAITIVRVESQSPPVATSVIPSATDTSSSGDIKITSIDCTSKPETVVIENLRGSSQNLTGWKMEDNGAKYIFTFPADFFLKPGESVKLLSGESGNDTDNAIHWNNRAVWNNDGDTASLFNRDGKLVSQKDCP